MEPQDAVVATNLTKYYTDFWGRKRVLALNDLSISIKRAETFGLLGPNGSGKTTFVKLILGLLFPTAGSVEVLGSPAVSAAVKSRIGFLPEESSLHHFMNADETMHFHGRLYGLSRQVTVSRTEKLLTELDIAGARRRRVKEYSKGMARRLGLACALIHEPEFLILDEPTSGLDPVGARRVKDMLLALKRENTTILLCSHLLSEVETVCDRIAILNHGKLLRTGSVKEMLTRQDMMSVLLKLKSPDDERNFRRALEAAGAQVAEIGPATLTLEELFLQTIGERQPPTDNPEDGQ
jgi:ABC-2 type transport system ATP-binding protein